MEESAAPVATTNTAPVESAPTEGAPQEAAPQKPASPEYFELKINGQNRRLTRDELIAKASINEAAHEKFQAAAEREKKYQSWKESAKKDFFQVLQDPELGLTKDQIRERIETWYKQEFIEPETLSPEHRRIQELERKIAAREAEDKEREEMTQKEREAEEARQTAQEMQQSIINILEKSGLEKTRFNASRIAYWMRLNLSTGYDAPEEVVLQQVKDERKQIIQTMVSTMDPHQLVELLGDDYIKKIRKYDMERINKKLNPTERPAESSKDMSSEAPRREKKGPKSMEDVDAYLRRMRFSR